MAAVYPNQYKSFATHRNLVEDVDASHVNNLQDEVAAIQQTLGISPHRTKVEMTTRSWASVATRLDYIQRGLGIPAIYLKKDADSYKRTSTSKTKYITWASPSRTLDPEGIFNGRSITANRTGFWQVFGRVIWTNAKGSLATGADREISIAVAGAKVMTQDMIPVTDGNTHMHIAWQGWVRAGQSIDLGIYHPVTNKTLSVGSLHLSASLIREMEPKSIPGLPWPG